jgi:hypothetical protein
MSGRQRGLGFFFHDSALAFFCEGPEKMKSFASAIRTMYIEDKGSPFIQSCSACGLSSARPPVS